ncbi:MAG: lipid-A-disaccharide synthase [Candidatus Rokubacteria bacterium]|nr:lipid-A-disaccharide synthase [Candidatus Rokubacteria bacterium]
MSASRETPGPTDILLVAGEASGDLHGATLARALTALAPGIRLAGMGGRGMAAAGVRILHGIDRTAVVGGTEVLGRLPALFAIFRDLCRRLSEERPGALVLIDFPDFNLRLARRAGRLGIPVVYFMAPQVWAWRRGRVRAMARDVRRVLAVFPFEVALYQEAGVPVEFVGHPLLDVLPALERSAAREGLATDRELLIGLLPGSRPAEVRRHLPVLLGAAARILRRVPRARFALPLAPTIAPDGVAAGVRRAALGIRVLPGEAYRVMAGSDLLLTASGTATLEAACYGTPMVVLYRLSTVSYALARLVVHGVSHISLPNIIVGRGLVPELIQGRATPKEVAGAALALLRDEVARAAQRAGLAEVRARLGRAGAAERAARAVLREGGYAVPA